MWPPASCELLLDVTGGQDVEPLPGDAEVDTARSEERRLGDAHRVEAAVRRPGALVVQGMASLRSAGRRRITSPARRLRA